MKAVGAKRSVKFRPRLAPFAILLALCMPITGAPAQSGKPRVPPGLDPGGVAVAIAADTGIDYTSPHIVHRLARDGEGELIGWDFVDDDRRPFDAAAASATGSVTSLARTILTEAGASRIAVFRAKPGDRIALGRMAVYAARSPARIAIVTSASANRTDWDAFAEVVSHFKGLLVIIPADPDVTTFPAALGLGNCLVVTAHEQITGNAVTIAPSLAIDIAVPAQSGRSDVAAARIAALAARLQAGEPALEGAALKARIVSLSRPLPAPHSKATKHGWIAEPHP